MPSKIYFGGAAACVLVWSTAGIAAAQTTPPKDDGAASVEVLVVTAERREQSLQKAPAPINVVGGDIIQKLKVDNADALTAFVPGLKMDGNARDGLRLGLRGAISSADNPGVGQSVGFYVDGVYYPHSSDVAAKLFDVQQVEVLRGPQGTLYGQNVAGGLIAITTRDPGQDLRVRAQVSLGSYNRRDISGTVSGPLSDTLSGSLSFQSTRSDGWLKNLTTGNRLDALDTFAARVKLVWRPNEDLTVRLIGEHSTDNTYGIPRSILYGDPARWVVPSSSNETRNAKDGRYDSESSVVSATVDYDFGWATLSGITSYQESKPTALEQSFMTDPVAIFTGSRFANNRTFTQEIRLSGETERLRWQFGGFYLRDDAARRQAFEVVAAPNTRYYDTGVRSNYTGDINRVLSKSKSLFGQATWDINDILSLTVGGRYSWDKKHSDFQNFGEPNATVGLLAAPPFRVFRTGKWSEFTPKVTLDAKWDDVFFLDSVLLYATVSKGYIAGDFAVGATPAESQGELPPETVLNYEAGFKTTFWNRRATFNLTAFDTNYKGLQTASTSAAGIAAQASTDAAAWGFEWDFTVRPLPGLDLSVGYAWLRNKLSAGAVAPNGTPVGGNRVPQAPKDTVNLMARYTRPIGPDTDLRLTAAYSEKASVFFDVRNARAIEAYRQSAQENLDLEAAIVHGRWDLSVWGRNLTNDRSTLRANDRSRTTGLTSAEFRAGETLLDGVLREPRTYGVTLTYEY